MGNCIRFEYNAVLEYYPNGVIKWERRPANSKRYIYTEYHVNGAKAKDIWYDGKKLQIRPNGLPNCVLYDHQNYKITAKWLSTEGKWHSHVSGAPNLVHYYPNGNKRADIWMAEGGVFQIRPNNLPNFIKFHENGNNKEQRWLDMHGNYVCQDFQPMCITYHLDGSVKATKWLATRVINFPQENKVDNAVEDVSNASNAVAKNKVDNAVEDVSNASNAVAESSVETSITVQETISRALE